MQKLYKLFFSFLVFCLFFSINDTQAKVCFIADADCGTNGVMLFPKVCPATHPNSSKPTCTITNQVSNKHAILNCWEKCSCPSNYKYGLTAPGIACEDATKVPNASNQCNGLSKDCVCNTAVYNKTCTGDYIGDSSACDLKYEKCKCNITDVSSSCSGNCKTKACENTVCKTCYTCADGAGLRSDIPSGTTCETELFQGLTCYKNCAPPDCAPGTIDHQTFGVSNLNLIMLSSDISTPAGTTKKCVPPCSKWGYGVSCSGPAISCPLDLSQKYCY